jgi:hypothetical protein
MLAFDYVEERGTFDENGVPQVESTVVAGVILPVTDDDGELVGVDIIVVGDRVVLSVNDLLNDLAADLSARSWTPEEVAEQQAIVDEVLAEVYGETPQSS